MITVMFTGKLAELCPEPIQVKAETPRQVLLALKSHPKLNPNKTNLRYEATIEGLKGVSALDEQWLPKEITINCTGTLTRLAGAGGSNSNPVVRLVIGIILIVVAVYTAGGSLAAGLTFTQTGMMAMSLGISLAAGALMEILAPSPDENDTRSHLASTYGNTVESGTTIAIILGEHLWGGQVISYNTKPQTSGSGWSYEAPVPVEYYDYGDAIYEGGGGYYYPDPLAGYHQVTRTDPEGGMYDRFENTYSSANGWSGTSTDEPFII